MSTQTTPIEAEDREQGLEQAVGQITPDDFKSDLALIDEACGLQPISIRLERALIEDFKAIATMNNLGYQTLMRQALKRFAECEMKRIVAEMATRKREAERAAEVERQQKAA